jgi:hypothetical protein
LLLGSASCVSFCEKKAVFVVNFFFRFVVNYSSVLY